MQNIPSHATDIRHLFRATAEAEYTVESEVEDNKGELVINNGHKLYTLNGLVFVTTIKQGDIILSENNEKEIKLYVNEVKSEGASTWICYDVI